jgi:2-oxoisovalerate dehydrogenase E2 component (dihydrolipoyl transacylase)
LGTHVIKLPDIGEGVAEAELIEWHVNVGDVVREDDVLAVVMTDKANIEVPSAVEGTVRKLGGEVGDTIAVGAELVRLEVAGAGNVTDEPAEAEACAAPTPEPEPEAARDEGERSEAVAGSASDKDARRALEARAAREAAPRRNAPMRERVRPVSARAGGEKPLASPSVRRRAREAGIDLRHVAGSGPAGRIVHEDIDAYLEEGALGAKPASRQRKSSIKEIKVVGLRRRIAEKMALAKHKIPHITIVEEVDVDNLEDLRTELNNNYADTRPKLTLLPFMMKAIVEAVREQPEMNAHFDDDEGVIRQYGGVNIGIATQTPNGLMVPVVHHAEVNSLWDNAAEIERLAAGAREGDLTREELTGSTISITSLGPLGAIATTPIINHPEVAIVGINKIAVRPWWDGQQFSPRKMMNISCSFDHRVIDGWNAAVFVQKLKSLIEKPAMLFVGS